MRERKKGTDQGRWFGRFGWIDQRWAGLLRPWRSWGPDEGFSAYDREILESGRGWFYRYDGTFPYIVATFDDLVGMLVMDEENAARVHLETADEVVHSWVEGTIGAYRRDAEPIDPDALA